VVVAVVVITLRNRLRKNPVTHPAAPPMAIEMRAVKARRDP